MLLRRDIRRSTPLTDPAGVRHDRDNPRLGI